MFDARRELAGIIDWLGARVSQLFSEQTQQSFEQIPTRKIHKGIIKTLKFQLPIEYQHLSSILYQSVIGSEKIQFIDLHVRVAKEKQEEFKTWCEEFEKKYSVFIYYRIDDLGKRTIKDELRPFADNSGLLTNCALEDLRMKLNRIHGIKLPGRDELDPPKKPLLEGRVDLRSDETLTLDSPGTTHFEDAFFCEHKEDGSLVLKIHFIDPTYYLSESSSIVSAAYDAGLSLYADTAHTIIDHEIIRTELSFNACENRPAITVQASWDPAQKKWCTSVFKSIINVKRNLKIGQIDEFLDLQEGLQLSLIRQAIGSLYSKNEKLAERNLEPFTRIFEERKGVEFLADCMVFAKSEIAKFMDENHVQSIWRSNKPFGEINRKDFFNRLQQKQIAAPSNVFDSADRCIELFKELQTRNERSLLSDLIGFLIGRSVYSSSAHGFKPLSLDHYLEIKCRDGSGLYNSFRLDAAINGIDESQTVTEKDRQEFANHMNRKRKGYDWLLYRARFLEMLVRHLPLVGQQIKGEIHYDINSASRYGTDGMELKAENFRYPILITSGEESVLSGQVRSIILDGFDLKKMRFVGRLIEDAKV